MQIPLTLLLAVCLMLSWPATARAECYEVAKSSPNGASTQPGEVVRWCKDASGQWVKSPRPADSSNKATSIQTPTPPADQQTPQDRAVDVLSEHLRKLEEEKRALEEDLERKKARHQEAEASVTEQEQAVTDTMLKNWMLARELSLAEAHIRKDWCDKYEPPTFALGRAVKGRQYRMLSKPVAVRHLPGRLLVTEFFFYGGRPSFDFDLCYLRPWLTVWGSNVDHVRVPVAWHAGALALAKIYYTAEQLGAIDKTHYRHYVEILGKPQPLGSRDEVSAYFARFGISSASALTAYDSFAVQKDVQQAAQLTRDAELERVPAIMINGTYVIEATAGSPANPYPAMIDVLQRLVADLQSKLPDPGKLNSQGPAVR